MLRIIVSLFFMILFTGCSEKQEKIVPGTKQINYDAIKANQGKKLPKIEKAIDRTISELERNVFNAKTCTSYIEERSNFLLFHGEKEYLSTEQIGLIAKRSYIIVKKLFRVRLLLRDYLVSFSKNGQMSDRCLSSFRKAFRYARFLEEFITEIGVSQYQNRSKAEEFDFTQNAYQFYLNPKYSKFELRTGDILLLRPSNFVSATIARIGDDDGQFSHGALVYVDEDNKVMILEALISKGLVSTPFNDWRKDNHDARIIQFRPYDTKEAEKLAKAFYTKTKKYHNNQSLIYDFQMDEKTTNLLFCSEVIQHTFSDIGVPTYKTSFKNFKNHNFLKNLTIETDKVFAPSDIEIEPKFELISEWRNYDTTNKTRLQDAVLTSILRWMSEEDYKLQNTLKSSVVTNIGYYGRHIFGLNSDTIPHNMPYGFLKTIIQLNDLNNVLESYLTKLNTSHIEKKGYPMTYQNMITELEKLKKLDYKNYQLSQNTKKYHKIIFHHLFHK